MHYWGKNTIIRPLFGEQYCPDNNQVNLLNFWNVLLLIIWFIDVFDNITNITDENGVNDILNRDRNIMRKLLIQINWTWRLVNLGLTGQIWRRVRYLPQLGQSSMLIELKRRLYKSHSSFQVIEVSLRCFDYNSVLISYLVCLIYLLPA